MNLTVMQDGVCSCAGDLDTLSRHLLGFPSGRIDLLQNPSRSEQLDDRKRAIKSSQAIRRRLNERSERLIDEFGKILDEIFPARRPPRSLRVGIVIEALLEVKERAFGGAAERCRIALVVEARFGDVDGFQQLRIRASEVAETWLTILPYTELSLLPDIVRKGKRILHENGN